MEALSRQISKRCPARLCRERGVLEAPGGAKLTQSPGAAKDRIKAACMPA